VRGWQWLGGWAEPLRRELEGLAPVALDVEDGMALPFRLYGALLGAKLMPHRPLLAQHAQRVLDVVQVRRRRRVWSHACTGVVGPRRGC
jgi:hypothetical protein